MYSRPVACAMESSSSNKSIQLLRTFDGLYIVHKRKGFEVGSSTSAQIEPILDIYILERRVHVRVFLKYIITPPPFLF